MGALFYANGLPDQISIGYIGFGMVRCQLARSFSEELGYIYEKPYKDMFFKGFSEEELERWNQICPEGLDLFLWVHDTDGKLSGSQCKKIISDLDKYPMKWPDDWRTDWLEKYERIKELIRWCAKTRHTLYIG